jgi:opacity protein-like surface antigen
MKNIFLAAFSLIFLNVTAQAAECSKEVIKCEFNKFTKDLKKKNIEKIEKNFAPYNLSGQCSIQIYVDDGQSDVMSLRIDQNEMEAHLSLISKDAEGPWQTMGGGATFSIVKGKPFYYGHSDYNLECVLGDKI